MPRACFQQIAGVGMHRLKGQLSRASYGIDACRGEPRPKELGIPGRILGSGKVPAMPLQRQIQCKPAGQSSSFACRQHPSVDDNQGRDGATPRNFECDHAAAGGGQIDFAQS